MTRGDSMLERIRTITKQKGQGIVEFALLLAFVVAIGVMANFGDSVIDRFNKVLDIVGEKKDYTYALENYSKLSKEKLQEIDPYLRIQIDQEALANIGRFFIGRNKAFVGKYLWKDNPSNTPLFHYGETVGEDGKVSSYFYYNRNDKNTRSSVGDEYAKTADVIHWMQGDFGTYDPETNSIVEGSYTTAAFDNTTRYLFSDYPVTKDTSAAGNGVKLWLTYDKNGIVTEAKVADNPASNQSLNVTVDKNKNYKPTNS